MVSCLKPCVCFRDIKPNKPQSNFTWITKSCRKKCDLLLLLRMLYVTANTSPDASRGIGVCVRGGTVSRREGQKIAPVWRGGK